MQARKDRKALKLCAATVAAVATLLTQDLSRFSAALCEAMGSCAKLWSVLAVYGAFAIASNASKCLLDGVPESNRRYIQDTMGNNVPIRISVGDWASAEIASVLARIFLNEVLGYHAVILPERRLTSITAFPLLAGCADWDCTEQSEQGHVALEVWVTGKNAELQQFDEQNPGKGPEDLGSIGYTGHNALCISGAVRDSAYGEVGLALEFYKSYNLSYHQAQNFFDPPFALEVEDFLPCNTSYARWTRQVQLEAYLHWTGDTEGVSNTSGKLQAHCPYGHFWLSPACRDDLAKCIPLVTAGDGWSVHVIMQWAFFHGMPVAMGIAKDFGLYAGYASSARTLFYCWLPDATHVHLDPSLVQFPRHEASEWEVSKYRTSDAESLITKMVSRDLRSKAPKVVKFLESFELDLSGMQHLLSETATGSVETVACEWVRSQRSRWQQWVPIETQCVQG